jgi:hypothetical protein
MLKDCDYIFHTKIHNIGHEFGDTVLSLVGSSNLNSMAC